ncbi:hypothetical protein FA95DRAFT_973117 [Auriscalpium vulgare]|uniref:Uncharacterized protein n=1 Tax=Auriscalpium vulgare TaxID=40419 RepID=A0ACB8RYF4_9AGAM|nr:hypothetical protein FA95DRAFT_973117 [Auriscalpium vulgare]
MDRGWSLAPVRKDESRPLEGPFERVGTLVAASPTRASTQSFFCSIPPEPCHEVHEMRTMLEGLLVRLMSLEEVQREPFWLQKIHEMVDELRQMDEEVPPVYRSWRDPRVQQVLRHGLGWIRRRIHHRRTRAHRAQQGYQSFSSYPANAATPAAPTYSASTSYRYTTQVGPVVQAPADGFSQSWQVTYASYVPPPASSAAPVHDAQPPSGHYAPIAPAIPYVAAAQNTHWPMSPRSSAYVPAAAAVPFVAPAPDHPMVTEQNALQLQVAWPPPSLPPPEQHAVPFPDQSSNALDPSQPQGNYYVPHQPPPPPSTPHGYIAEHDGRRTPASSSVPDVDTAVDVAVRLIEAVSRAITLISQLGGI